MTESPDELLRGLEAAQPALPALPAPDEHGSGAEGRGRDGLLGRLRAWLARRLDRDQLTTWVRRRFLPWINDQTRRSTRAGRAFWEALTPDERSDLRAFLADAARHPRDAVKARSKHDLAVLIMSLRRGLLAARDNWRDAD